MPAASGTREASAAASGTWERVSAVADWDPVSEAEVWEPDWAEADSAVIWEEADWEEAVDYSHRLQQLVSNNYYNLFGVYEIENGRSTDTCTCTLILKNGC